MGTAPAGRCRCLQELPWKWQHCCSSSAVPVQIAWPYVQPCAHRAAGLQQGMGLCQPHCRDLRAAAWEHPCSPSMLTSQRALRTAVAQRAAIRSAGMWPPGGLQSSIPARGGGILSCQHLGRGGLGGKHRHCSSTLWICCLGSGDWLCSARGVPAVCVWLWGELCFQMWAVLPWGSSCSPVVGVLPCCVPPTEAVLQDLALPELCWH